MRPAMVGTAVASGISDCACHITGRGVVGAAVGVSNLLTADIKRL